MCQEKKPLPPLPTWSTICMMMKIKTFFFYGWTYLYTHTNIAIKNQECQKKKSIMKAKFSKKKNVIKDKKKLFVNEKW
jgi:hypothetical protein